MKCAKCNNETEYGIVVLMLNPEIIVIPAVEDYTDYQNVTDVLKSHGFKSVIVCEDCKQLLTGLSESVLYNRPV